MTSVLSLRNLRKDFAVGGGLFSAKRTLRAVDDVSLDVGPGETVGLVGESGCGKSTLGRMAIRLLEPTSGKVEFEGTEITKLPEHQLRPLRRRMQIVFQDPYSALNPRMTIGQAISEPLDVHGITQGDETRKEMLRLLDRVGLRSEAATRYPHEMSGGQRQRAVIARALSVRPIFVVADEPVSALDVSVQAQVLNLLRDLQDELGLAFLFVAHDLRVVEFMSQRIAVMYLGRIVELATRDALFSEPKHPYTRVLLRAIPDVDAVVAKRDSTDDSPASKKRLPLALKGELPSPLDPPPGCAFHPRCEIAQPGLCDKERPALRDVGGRFVACHLA